MSVHSFVRGAVVSLHTDASGKLVRTTNLPPCANFAAPPTELLPEQRVYLLRAAEWAAQALYWAERAGACHTPGYALIQLGRCSERAVRWAVHLPADVQTRVGVLVVAIGDAALELAALA